MKVAKDHGEDGGKVIAISEDLFAPGVNDAEAMANVRRMMAALAIPFPVLILKDATLDAVNERFALPGPIPCTVALDRDGREVDREEDAASEQRLREMMRRALGREPETR